MSTKTLGSILIFLCYCLHLSSTPLDISVSAEAAILMNADSGAILYEKNAQKCYHPASITKVATAVYALSLCGSDLDLMVSAHHDCIVSVTDAAKKKAQYTLPAHWLEPGGTHIGIKKGEELSLRDLFHGMMLVSGNDAANVIAHHTAGTVPDFMKGLNAYIRSLGCQNTTFYNPHGLHHPDHVSTAYDMAIITKEGLKNPDFREIVKTVKYQRPKTNLQEATTLVQTNRLLKQGPYFNPDAIGVKTGYIASAAHTFVAAAERNGRTLIAVLLKSKERKDNFSDANRLFESAFQQPIVKKVYLSKGAQHCQLKLEGAAAPLKTFTESDISLEFYPAEEPQVKCLLNWGTALNVPVSKGQSVGEIKLCRINGEVLWREPLLALEEVKPTLSYRLKQMGLKPVWAVLTILFLLFIFLFFQRER